MSINQLLVQRYSGCIPCTIESLLNYYITEFTGDIVELQCPTRDYTRCPLEYLPVQPCCQGGAFIAGYAPYSPRKYNNISPPAVIQYCYRFQLLMIHQIKVIIAEDHSLMRDSLRHIITREQRLQLSAEAAGIEELLQLTSIHQPDVIVTGIDIPVAKGVEAATQVATSHPLTGIIVFSNCGEAEIINGITAAGIPGYVMKTSEGQEVINAIDAVYCNRSYCCSNTLKVLKAASALPRKANGTDHTQYGLTEREQQVMLLVCDEKSNKEISLLLTLSVRTVEDYRQKILSKTQSKNVAGIVKYAVRHKLYLPSIYFLLSLLPR